MCYVLACVKSEAIEVLRATVYTVRYRTAERSWQHLPLSETMYDKFPVTFEPPCPDVCVVSYGSEISSEPLSSHTSLTLADLSLPVPLPLVIRATNGKSKDKRAKKVKLSTIVQPDALQVFFGRYAEVCKAGMIELKKRDRSKAKEKLKAKKKKMVTAASVEVKH